MITSENLRGLTLHRPWPWAMTVGSKRIENRCEKTAKLLRGWRGKYLALHAGKTWDYDGAGFIRRLHPGMPGSSDDHPLGIVAVVRVGETIEHRPWRPNVSNELAVFQTRWFFGPYGTMSTRSRSIRFRVAVRRVCGSCRARSW